MEAKTWRIMSSGLESNIFHHLAFIILPVKRLFDQKSPKIGNFVNFPYILTNFLPLGSIVDHQMAKKGPHVVSL